MVHSQLRTYLQNNVLDALTALANKYQVALNVIARSDFHHEDIRIVKQVDSTIRAESKAAHPAGRKTR
ncbi:MAG: hypothetical protein M1457_08380 [bacterium]|nr:hypothetical protein [bacterium]